MRRMETGETGHILEAEYHLQSGEVWRATELDRGTAGSRNLAQAAKSARLILETAQGEQVYIQTSPHTILRWLGRDSNISNDAPHGPYRLWRDRHDPMGGNELQPVATWRDRRALGATLATIGLFWAGVVFLILG